MKRYTFPRRSARFAASPFFSLGLLLTLILTLTFFIDASAFAPSIGAAAGMALATGAGVLMTEKEVEEFKGLLGEIKGDWSSIKGLPGRLKEVAEKHTTEVKTLGDENAKLRSDLDALRRKSIAPGGVRSLRPAGGVSVDCAKYLGAVAVIGAAGNKRKVDDEVVTWAKRSLIDVLDTSNGEPQHRELTEFAKNLREAQVRTALTTTDIPMPASYMSEVVELVSEFGSFRRLATTFPLSKGTTKLPKLSTSPAFGFVDMSASIGEKSPQIAFVDFDPKKAGGIVRIPSEIEMDSIVPLGQFIARYIAREMASWEDEVGWKADGSATYKTLEGVVDKIVDNSKHVTLATGNTSSDDVTLASLRSARAKVHESVLQSGRAAYYLHPTMESILAAFNNDTNGQVYQVITAGGVPTLDGFPIRWINKLPVNSSTAIINTIIAAFGDMSFWYLGLAGGINIDTSAEAYFATDEIGVRALQRFTVKEMATEHMAGVRTAAS